jgi:predicted esterase
LANIDGEDFHGLDASRTTIEALVNEEIKAGTPSKRIILAGFSQGAALSIFTGLQFSQTLGGILALSGYLPYRGDLSKVVHAENKQTPLMMAHGEADQVVSFAIGQKSFKAIQAARPDNLTFKSYRGVGHHSSEEEMRDVASWMKKILG